MTMRKVTNTHEALKTRHFFVTLLKHQKSCHVFTYLSVYSKGISRKKTKRDFLFLFIICAVFFVWFFKWNNAKHTFFITTLPTYFSYTPFVSYYYSTPTKILFHMNCSWGTRVRGTWAIFFSTMGPWTLCVSVTLVVFSVPVI